MVTLRTLNIPLSRSPDEGDKYRILLGGYNGTAGDSMATSLQPRSAK